MSKKMLVVLTIVLLACAAPKIDTSSDEAMKRSIERVRQSLPEAKRAEFDNAVRHLALADVEEEGRCRGACEAEVGWTQCSLESIAHATSRKSGSATRLRLRSGSGPEALA